MEEAAATTATFDKHIKLLLKYTDVNEITNRK